MKDTQETRVQSLGRKDPLEKEKQPILVFLPGKKPMEGAWQVTVHEVAKSQTQLSTLAQHR